MMTMHIHPAGHGEITASLSVAVIEVLYLGLALLQSGGVVFYRVTTETGFYHTESMSVLRVVLPCTAILEAMTLLASVISYRFRLGLMQILLPVQVLLFAGIAVQTFVNPAGLEKHVITILPGLVVMVALIFLVNVRLHDAGFKLWCHVMIIVSVASCAYGMTHMVNGNGAWISIGGISFQVGELFKLLILLLPVIGYDCITRDRGCTLSYILSCLVMLGNLLLVNDLGDFVIAAFLFLVIVSSLGFYRILRKKAILLSVLPACIMILYVIEENSGKITRRISQWLYYPLTHYDASSEANLHLRTSLLSILRGGVLGVGTNGSNPLYASNVYSSESDFVIAAGTSIFGAGFAAIVVGALVVLAFNASPARRIAQTANFKTHLSGMLILLYITQTGVNLLGSLSLLPETGVTASFISAGGSSMIISFAAAGAVAGLRLPRAIRVRIADSFAGIEDALAGAFSRISLRAGRKTSPSRQTGSRYAAGGRPHGKSPAGSVIRRDGSNPSAAGSTPSDTKILKFHDWSFIDGDIDDIDFDYDFLEDCEEY